MRGVGTDYNPWAVRGAQFEQQRRHREQARKRREEQSSKQKNSESSKSGPPRDRINRDRPDDDRGLVWDALRFIYESQKSLMSVHESFQKLKEPINKSLDESRTDMDRKLFQRQYLMAKSKYNRAVGSCLVMQKTPLFVGDYAIKPYSLPLSLSGSKSLDLTIPNMTASGLEMGHLRIDSLIPARRAQQRVIAAEEKFKALSDYLHGREQFLKHAGNEMKMILPNFSDLEQDAQKAVESEEAISSPVYSRAGSSATIEGALYDPAFLHLKHQQQALAEKKGRGKALLVSLKV